MSAISALSNVTTVTYSAKIDGSLSLVSSYSDDKRKLTPKLSIELSYGEVPVIWFSILIAHFIAYVMFAIQSTQTMWKNPIQLYFFSMQFF